MFQSYFLEKVRMSSLRGAVLIQLAKQNVKLTSLVGVVQKMNLLALSWNDIYTFFKDKVLLYVILGAFGGG